MKMALMGYGKMGKLIEEFACQKGYSIVARISSKNKDLASVKKADILIDFSHPDVVIENIHLAASIGKNIVVGTTGWETQEEKIKNLVTGTKIGLIHSPNFSIGVFLFFQMISHAASLMAQHDQYEVGIWEAHHRHKVDSPSGTGLKLSKIIEEQRENPCSISSIRCGSIPGTHSVFFDSPFDTITLTHQARNREGLAQGAITAAEWLIGKRGFFTLNDMFKN